MDERKPLVSGNRLKSLDGLSGCRKMTELDASDNFLTAGSQSMSAQRLTRRGSRVLKWLHVRHKRLKPSLRF